MRRKIQGTRPHGARRVLAPALAALVLALSGSVPAPQLPFAPGEEAVFRGSNRLGRIGTGTMAVEGPEEVRGQAAYVLRFDFRGGVGPVRVEDRTRSWFDPATRASVRYSKRERSPLSSRVEEVEMDAAARHWSSAGGGGGEMPTAAPLDELSFLYFIRTLPLREGESHTLARHFDAGRNPVTVRVVGRETLRVPAGEFRTVEVEMRVRDRARYRGEGVIRMHLTDDARRVPVRIESNVPRAGRLVLSLERYTPGR